MGVSSRDCSGPCAQGHVCPEGSVRNASIPCPAGSFNPDIGGGSLAACKLSPAGSYVVFVGANAAE
eukprot:3304818-Prymnesium_polylepis.1